MTSRVLVSEANRERNRPWSVLGVPSSAAAHWAGLDKGPGALRSAGLMEALHRGPVAVRDCGDQPEALWAPLRQADRPNNADAVLEVLVNARTRIVELLEEGARPLIIGGECTLAIAMVSAFVTAGRDVGMIWVDGGQDLAIPADHPDEPILDSMGVAHMLDLPGTDDAIAGIGPRRPLLRDSDVVFLGFTDDEEDVHGQVGSVRIPGSIVSADPAAAARRAIAGLSNDHVVVHIDVDVLDFLQVPAADVPSYGRGLSLRDLTELLRVLLQEPRCAGALLVEYNPDHDPERVAAKALVSMLQATLA
ncbi:arginase family protein [Microbacterium jiangjiandongii]|uniref:arginase family protein n=1 Tax=Microbacterium jiangjiandongii TaxID=3049071 RepID=UPI00214BAF51|nr:arginase family protein [Microbacterium sp. zg.Y843]MCR2816881.1 arginase family protein [Microbacterium sp. zg.Y843]